MVRKADSSLQIIIFVVKKKVILSSGYMGFVVIFSMILYIFAIIYTKRY